MGSFNLLLKIDINNSHKKKKTLAKLTNFMKSPGLFNISNRKLHFSAQNSKSTPVKCLEPAGEVAQNAFSCDQGLASEIQ